MEPIVLLGLIVVGYAGYVAFADMIADLSVLFPRLFAGKGSRLGGERSRDIRQKAGVKKMAGLHV